MDLADCHPECRLTKSKESTEQCPVLKTISKRL